MIKETSLATIEAEQSAFRAVALPHLFSHVSDAIRGNYEEEEAAECGSLRLPLRRPGVVPLCLQRLPSHQFLSRWYPRIDSSGSKVVLGGVKEP